MDTINQPYEFNGKIYKTLTAAKSARTRYKIKKLKNYYNKNKLEKL